MDKLFLDLSNSSQRNVTFVLQRLISLETSYLPMGYTHRSKQNHANFSVVNTNQGGVPEQLHSDKEDNSSHLSCRKSECRQDH